MCLSFLTAGYLQGIHVCPPTEDTANRMGLIVRGFNSSCLSEETLWEMSRFSSTHYTSEFM